MSAPSLLELARAANEAAIAYTEAIDTDIRYLRETEDIVLTRFDLLDAVDALTSAVVEAENDRPHSADIAAAKAVMEWVDADPSRRLIGCTPAMLAQIAVTAYRGRSAPEPGERLYAAAAEVIDAYRAPAPAPVSTCNYYRGGLSENPPRKPFLLGEDSE